MNIIYKNFNQSKNNQIKEDKLQKKTVLDFDYTFNKKKQEIILLDNEYSLGTTKFLHYTFTNLDDKYLKFLHPYVLISTSPGFSDENLLTYTTFIHWESYLSNSINIKKLNIRVNAYFLYFTGSFWSSNIVPIYLTVKIKILNPHLFDILVRYQ